MDQEGRTGGPWDMMDRWTLAAGHGGGAETKPVSPGTAVMATGVSYCIFHILLPQAAPQFL